MTFRAKKSFKLGGLLRFVPGRGGRVVVSLLTGSAFSLSLHNSSSFCFLFYFSVQNMNLYDSGTPSGALTLYTTHIWRGVTLANT